MAEAINVIMMPPMTRELFFSKTPAIKSQTNITKKKMYARVIMEIDFLIVAKAKIKLSANCLEAHMKIKKSTPFALRSILSAIDCGEKNSDTLTPSSINAKSPETISIYFGNDFCSCVI